MAQPTTEQWTSLERKAPTKRPMCVLGGGTIRFAAIDGVLPATIDSRQVGNDSLMVLARGCALLVTGLQPERRPTRQSIGPLS